jgi:membrane-associated phospholipid phosphatase
MNLPDRSRWIAYCKFLALFCLLFFPIFFGVGYLERASGRALDLYFAWENELPFVSWMIIPYLSLFPLFVLPVLHGTAEGIGVLSRQSTLALLIAGLVFIAAPARLGFAPRPDARSLQPLYDFIEAVDSTRPFTAVPSLHVAFATLILLSCAAVAPRPLAAFYYLWLALLATSTVLTHQHHLTDVATGFALALGVRAMIPHGAAPISEPNASPTAIRPLDQ